MPPGCVSATVLLPHNFFCVENPSCEGQIKFLKCLDKGNEQETVVEFSGRKILILCNKYLNNSWNCSFREDASLGVSGKTEKI